MNPFCEGFVQAIRDARTVIAWPVAWGLFWLGHTEK